jgi:hypothetical protein
VKDNQNNKINLQLCLINAELNEKLTKFEILSKVLLDSLIYINQASFNSSELTQEELNIIRDKYEQHRAIIEEALNLGQRYLNSKNITAQ